MFDTTVVVENVSKKLCRSLSEGMLYTATDIARDTIGIKTKSTELRKKEFWALKDVTFELRRGECLGLIGPNGAGKSTMLKLLNGILRPDAGQIRIRGRVGALIEVGAGFHPMLSGRENIYVNGAILGMNAREIKRKYDDIVEFSGLDRSALDAPVKTYSSGMYVRLGFAIAVSATPDILLIDEVFAVGDGAFQLRCRERFNEMRKQGVSIVFVSHSLALVNSLADRTLVLNRGAVQYLGDTARAIGEYTSLVNTSTERQVLQDADDYYHLRVADVRINGLSRMASVRFGSALSLEIDIEAAVDVPDGVLCISLWNTEGVTVAAYTNRELKGALVRISRGRCILRCDLDGFRLAPGRYTVGVALSDSDVVANYLCDVLTTLTVEQHPDVDRRYGYWVEQCTPHIEPVVELRTGAIGGQ